MWQACAVSKDLVLSGGNLTAKASLTPSSLLQMTIPLLNDQLDVIDFCLKYQNRKFKIILDSISFSISITI